MKKISKWYLLSLVTSIITSSLLTFYILKPEIDHKPFWHPFELNANINLQSLVAEGYRCMAIPCGQAQFIKFKGDTFIQYDVSSINCNPYDGHYERPEITFDKNEVEFEPKKKNKIDTIHFLSDSAKYEERLAYWKEKSKTNPASPYILEEIEDCYQGIDWRIYGFYMKTIDSIAILNFVRRNNAYYIEDLQNWNSKDGGSFLVYHHPSKLYFVCDIKEDDTFTWTDSINWVFTIYRTIPYLDQQRQKLENIREEKRQEYYHVLN